MTSPDARQGAHHRHPPRRSAHIILPVALSSEPATTSFDAQSKPLERHQGHQTYLSASPSTSSDAQSATSSDAHLASGETQGDVVRRILLASSDASRHVVRRIIHRLLIALKGPSHQAFSEIRPDR